MPTIPGDFKIIDPHIHQWDLAKTPRILSLPKKLLGWNKPLYEGVLNIAAQKADRDHVGKLDYVGYDYLVGDYASDAAGLNITDVVHVEAKWVVKKPMDAVNETRWLEDIFNSQANQTKVNLGGVVGYVELRNAKAEQVIKAHKAASSKFVGVRQMLAWDNDKGVVRYCDKPRISKDRNWRKNFHLLEKHDLSFDAWFFHKQLNEMIELANSFPNIRFMLCHMGTPVGLAGPFASYGHTVRDRDLILRQWQDSMAKVAECPNVSVKLSGFFMPVLGWGYHFREQQPSVNEVLDTLKPLVDFVIEQFGVDRCMFASNFPMDKVSMSLQQLYEVYWDIATDYSEEDRSKLFFENAAKFYRIKKEG